MILILLSFKIIPQKLATNITILNIVTRIDIILLTCQCSYKYLQFQNVLYKLMKVFLINKCSSHTDITISNSVTKIDENAFHFNCKIIKNEIDNKINI